MKTLKLAFWCCVIGLTVMPAYAGDNGKVLEIKLTMRDGRGDSPMAVLWVENDDGDFIKTLQMFCKKKKYHKDMLAWKFKSRKAKGVRMDAVSGATIKWKRSRTITVPVKLDKHNLLDGTYILRIESRKDKGGHYRSFKIPLTKDYKGETHEHEGYVKQVEIVIKDKAS